MEDLLPRGGRASHGDILQRSAEPVELVPVSRVTPAEVVVTPDIARRWKMLYYKRNEELTQVEREEFSLLMGAISERAGKSVFCPRI